MLTTKYPILTLFATYDTAMNKGLIVDATTHNLALYYIKQREEERLQVLLQQNDIVNICQMNSLHDVSVPLSSSLCNGTLTVFLPPADFKMA
jgi:hypothetical protein